MYHKLQILKIMRVDHFQMAKAKWNTPVTHLILKR